jgi:hypothetical protein
MKGKHPLGKASMNTLLMIPAALLFLSLMWIGPAIVAISERKAEQKEAGKR